MAFPNVSMAGREPPHMGPVAHGVAVLGDAAQRAVSQLAALAADAVQAPSRLSQAAALLTDDGRVGTVWRVTARYAASPNAVNPWATGPICGGSRPAIEAFGTAIYSLPVVLGAL